MPNPRIVNERLDALYAELPHLDCQGLCHDSCGAITMSIAERQRIEREHGKITASLQYADCSMLTPDRRCKTYDTRPMICRLWGLVESLPCPYGCRPEGGLLTDLEGYTFIARADLIGGDADGRRPHEVQQALDALRARPDAEAHARRVARALTPRPHIGGRQQALRHVEPGIALPQAGGPD